MLSQPARVICLSGLLISHWVGSAQPQSGPPFPAAAFGKISVSLDASVTVVTDLDTLINSGDETTVSWQGVSNPTSSDAIVLYIPYDADPQATAFARWRPATDDGGYLSSGKGSLRFKLLNYGQPMAFAFLRGSSSGGSWILLARSNPIKLRDPNEPIQGHLALTGTPGEMAVMWTQKQASEPKVYWGTEAGNWENVATGSSSSYGQGDMCGAPASGLGWTAPGTLLQAVLTGLAPDTTYYYKFGDVTYYFSPVLTFRTPPRTGASASVQALFFSGSGQALSDGSLAALASPAPAAVSAGSALAGDVSSGAALVIGGGDLACTGGQLSAWNAFFNLYKSTFQAAAFMPVRGTCENSGGECGVPFSDLFPLPSRGAPHYSYDYGPIHFAHLDAGSFSGGGLGWLQKDLSGVDRTRTPFVVVVSGGLIGEQPGDTADALFRLNKVAVVLQGGQGLYARTRAQSNSDGPVYVMAGTAGLELAPTASALPATYVTTMTGRHAYVRLKAGLDGLQVEAIATQSGSVLDSFTLPAPTSH